MSLTHRIGKVDSKMVLPEVDNAYEFAGVIQPGDLFQSLDKGSTLILDIRPPSEFNSQHIRESKNIPKELLEKYLDTINEPLPIVLICENGKKSRHAACRLHDKGLDIHALEGGILLWRCSGFPTQHKLLSLPPKTKADIVFGAGALATAAMLWSALPHSFFVGVSMLCLMAAKDVAQSFRSNRTRLPKRRKSP